MYCTVMGYSALIVIAIMHLEERALILAQYWWPKYQATYGAVKSDHTLWKLTLHDVYPLDWSIKYCFWYHTTSVKKCPKVQARLLLYMLYTIVVPGPATWRGLGQHWDFFTWMIFCYWFVVSAKGWIFHMHKMLFHLNHPTSACHSFIGDLLPPLLNMVMWRQTDCIA